MPNISLADTDIIAVLNDLKFEYLRKIGDDVDRRRRELQEERREMVSKNNEGRQEQEEQDRKIHSRIDNCESCRGEAVECVRN